MEDPMGHVNIWKSYQGAHNRPLFKTRVPKDRATGISYVRALLGNTILKDTMHSHRLADSPKCDCSLSRETLEHFMCYLLLNVRPCMLNIKGSFQKGSVHLCRYNPSGQDHVKNTLKFLPSPHGKHAKNWCIVKQILTWIPRGNM